jgi:hypothetical protein
MLFCHRGSTFGPPADLRVGEVLVDASGRQWAYTGESEDGSRCGAAFVIHQQKPPEHLPACPPPQAPSRSPALRKEQHCLATTYMYRQDLRIIRYDFAGKEKKKEFQPQFLVGDQWHIGSGPEVWPFYGSLGTNGEDCIIEVEGEKCVDALRAQGIAAITHPGHQRDEQGCTERYKMLAGAGIKTVYYVSDNNAAGRKYAEKFARWSVPAKLNYRIIPAESIWADTPEGGSVDDMPAEQLTTLIPAAIKTAAGAKPASVDRTSYAALKKALQELQKSSVQSSADISAAIADIAASHGASLYDAKRIWDSLEEDRAVAADALSATGAIAKRQELEKRRAEIKLSHYLPEGICGAVEELTGNLACDSLASIALVLTTVSGVVRSGHRLDAGDGLFVKEPVIWTLLSGPSGSGKSPAMRILSKDRLRLVYNYYDNETQKMYNEWFLRCSSLPKGKGPEEPQPLRTCITDFTTESLNGILVDNHNKGLGTFIYSEEVREILGNFDEFKGRGKGRGKETFLCLFDGNINAQHRVGRRSKPVPGKVQNALLGGVQPGVFRMMVENGDDAGLFARCLIVPLSTEYVEPNFSRTPAEITAVHLANQALENFYLRCLAIDPLVLRLDADAIQMFIALSRDTYNKSQMVTLESQRAIYGKRLGYVLQVALTMHIAKVAAGEADPEELYIGRQTLARAIIFVDLLQSYAIVEQQESQMQQHGSFDLNRRIHTFARARSGVTAREFSASCIPVRLRSFIRINNVRSAMEQLVAMGLGEWRQGDGKNEVFQALGKYPD